MKFRRLWIGVGAGLLLWLAAGWGALQSATAPMQTQQMLAELRLGVWLPPWLQGWPVGALILGGVFLVASLVSAGVSLAARGAAPKRAKAVVSSPFSTDPWDDAPTLIPSADGALPVSERVALLWQTARDLEARGRLRAAREMYRQAYELASHTPEWAARQGEIALAERKVARRLAQTSVNRRAWAWPWPVPSATPQDSGDEAV